jgi:hypothetical protein
MKVMINSLIYLGHRERQLVREAAMPYRVLLGEYTENPEKHDAFHKRLNRIDGACRLAYLLEIHGDLVDLRDALQHDADVWELEARNAPLTSKGLIMKPRETCQMLAETRRRQDDMCKQALEVIERAMKTLQPITKITKRLCEGVNRRLEEDDIGEESCESLLS